MEREFFEGMLKNARAAEAVLENELEEVRRYIRYLEAFLTIEEGEDGENVDE